MDPLKKGTAVDEDDEFEDFNAETWGNEPLKMDNLGLWDNSWDDDTSNDHVQQQLRRKLTELKQSQAVAPAANTS